VTHVRGHEKGLVHEGQNCHLIMQQTPPPSRLFAAVEVSGRQQTSATKRRFKLSGYL
jgi:hypothetical protein